MKTVTIIPFKDDNIKFQAKGNLRQDATKKFGIHLC